MKAASGSPRSTNAGRVWQLPYIRHMTSHPAPKRAILYLRLSESKEESTSIARQRQDLEALAEREGWIVVEILTDDGLSGGKVRENAEHALEALRTGAADVVAVYKWDRWSRMGARTVADLQDVLDERASKHSPALFVALQDGLRSDSPAWDIQVAVLAARVEAEPRRRAHAEATPRRELLEFPAGARHVVPCSADCGSWTAAPSSFRPAVRFCPKHRRRAA